LEGEETSRRIKAPKKVEKQKQRKQARMQSKRKIKSLQEEEAGSKRPKKTNFNLLLLSVGNFF